MGEMSGSGGLNANLGTVRGQPSWAFIYIALGFALTIEGTIIQMIEPLNFPWNVIAYIVVGAIPWWLFIENNEFQTKLLAFKTNYENRARY
jgi:hypothetical protein